MLKEYTLKTDKEGLYNITARVVEAVRASGVKDGVAVVYCPHTTGGITINENCDPDVVTDLLFGLAKAFPDRAEFRHAEGNSAAHLKSSCVGASQYAQQQQRPQREWWFKQYSLWQAARHSYR